MSAELMIKAFEISEADARLTPVDKLVLLRWAWKTADASKPYEIRFRTVARDLGVSRNAVKASVRRLSECGYLMAVSIKVVAGPAFQQAETGQSVTRATTCHTGQSVTRDGSLSDPLKGHSVTRLQRKKKKEEPSAVSLDQLSDFQKRCIRSDQSVMIGGEVVSPNSLSMQALRLQLLALEKV